MKFYVVEVQNDNGTYAHLVHTADTRMGAESVYHQVLSYAAISTLTTHAAIMFTGEGYPIMHQSYSHAAEPTPEPEESETEPEEP